MRATSTKFEAILRRYSKRRPQLPKLNLNLFIVIFRKRMTLQKIKIIFIWIFCEFILISVACNKFLLTKKIWAVICCYGWENNLRYSLRGKKSVRGIKQYISNTYVVETLCRDLQLDFLVKIRSDAQDAFWTCLKAKWPMAKNITPIAAKDPLTT